MEYISREFKQHNWRLYEKNENERVYRRKGLEFFTIKRTKYGKISVSFPMKNSKYNYETEFDNYTDVYDYVVDKLKYLSE